MPSMIEQVASALYARFPHGQLVEDRAGRQALTGIPWEQLGSASRVRWLEDAKAAILALKQPTPAFLERAAPRGDAANASQMWQHMIDAALAEEG